MPGRANTQSGSYFMVPSPRFHSDYSGITLLIGDRFLPTRVHQLKLGDMLKLGSSVLLVERVTWDLEEEDNEETKIGDNKRSAAGEKCVPEELSADLLKACGGIGRGASATGRGVGANDSGAGDSIRDSISRLPTNTNFERCVSWGRGKGGFIEYVEYVFMTFFSLF